MARPSAACGASVGSKPATNRTTLSKSRRKKNSARELCAAEMTCGKSMMVGPSWPARMLYGDRSPWMTSRHNMAMSCATRSAYTTTAWSGAIATSIMRGAGRPSPSTTSSISKTPS